MEKKIKKSDVILIALIILFGGMFAFGAFSLFQYYRAYQAESELDQLLTGLREETVQSAQIQDKKAANETDTEKEAAMENHKKLLAINKDYQMWLTIPDTAVSYPVVQRDNEYYLNHDFMGEKNSHGAIFLDEGCMISDDMLLLHGHHMKDGTMFGGLKAYKKANFAKEHTTLYLDFGFGDEEYRIFAVALVDLGSETHFSYYDMPRDAMGKKNYLEKLKRASFWYQDEDDRSGKDRARIVLLSTCEYGTADQRLVVAAVKLEP